MGLLVEAVSERGKPYFPNKAAIRASSQTDKTCGKVIASRSDPSGR